MWALIFTLILFLAILATIFFIIRIHQFFLVQKLTNNNRLYSYLLSVGIFLVGLVFLRLAFDYINMVIILLFLLLFWLIYDFLFWILQKLIRKKFKFKLSCIFSIVTTVIYLTIGWVLAHNIWVVNYDIQSIKKIESLRIVMFADSHIGATFDGNEFAARIDKIQQENPDVVLICGDFIDDDTKKEDMILACKALGKLKTTYGVYFVFGNHDAGYYDYRGYTSKDLIQNLKENNIIVLQDDVASIGEDYLLIGRRDASDSSREHIKDLIEPLDKNRFLIVMDHQPNDYENEAAVNVDLVLSGHTHGGQLFPVTYVGEWLGMNDKTYGYEKRNNTNFIVTSGISDWAIKFKTGCKSEIVVVTIYNTLE